MSSPWLCSSGRYSTKERRSTSHTSQEGDTHLPASPRPATPGATGGLVVATGEAPEPVTSSACHAALHGAVEEPWRPEPNARMAKAATPRRGHGRWPGTGTFASSAPASSPRQRTRWPAPPAPAATALRPRSACVVADLRSAHPLRGPDRCRAIASGQRSRRDRSQLSDSPVAGLGRLPRPRCGALIMQAPG